MKKIYMQPDMEVVEMRTMGMLCVSGPIDGDADENALSPDLLEFVTTYDELATGQE